MAKVDIDLVKMVLQRANLEATQVAQIIEDINFEQKEAKKDEEKPEIQKKQFVIVVSDPYGKFVDADYSGWVVQIPEEDSAMSALEKIHKGAYDYNISGKGRKLSLKTIAEACEFGSAKIFKEHKIWIKTKEPVLVVRTNNKIPTE